MLTLFTKSPLPRKANTRLLQKYGYPPIDDPTKLELHSTVHESSFYTIKGIPTLKIEMHPDKIELIDYQHEVWGYWTKDTLKKIFDRKLPQILYVKAESRGTGKDEEFWYNEAWLLNGFDFEGFLKLLKEDSILVDIRIGRNPDGSRHDHGTGFRVHQNKLELCFKERRRVI